MLALTLLLLASQVWAQQPCDDICTPIRSKYGLVCGEDKSVCGQMCSVSRPKYECLGQTSNRDALRACSACFTEQNRGRLTVQGIEVLDIIQTLDEFCSSGCGNACADVLAREEELCHGAQPRCKEMCTTSNLDALKTCMACNTPENGRLTPAGIEISATLNDITAMCSKSCNPVCADILAKSGCSGTAVLCQDMCLPANLDAMIKCNACAQSDSSVPAGDRIDIQATTNSLREQCKNGSGAGAAGTAATTDPLQSTVGGVDVATSVGTASRSAGASASARGTGTASSAARVRDDSLALAVVLFVACVL